MAMRVEASPKTYTNKHAVTYDLLVAVDEM
jgi:hypothetical protein